MDDMKLPHLWHRWDQTHRLNVRLRVVYSLRTCRGCGLVQVMENIGWTWRNLEGFEFWSGTEKNELAKAVPCDPYGNPLRRPLAENPQHAASPAW